MSEENHNFKKFYEMGYWFI